MFWATRKTYMYYGSKTLVNVVCSLTSYVVVASFPGFVNSL